MLAQQMFPAGQSLALAHEMLLPAHVPAAAHEKLPVPKQQSCAGRAHVRLKPHRRLPALASTLASVATNASRPASCPPSGTTNASVPTSLATNASLPASKPL